MLKCVRLVFLYTFFIGLRPELTKRASRLFRHALLAHVDGAIRSSNAQYDDPRVLERIDVKILQGSPGDDGWKVFTLDYSVAGTPLNAIITDKSMANYLQIFRFLWRIKRVESSLSLLWQRTLTTSKVRKIYLEKIFVLELICVLHVVC